MKKVLYIKLLSEFLAVIGLFIIFLFYLGSSKVDSSPFNDKVEYFPIKRPVNLLNLEESADTIFNMIQKVGAKPIGDVKKTTLKQNENLSSALKRIEFESFQIGKIINSINNLQNGKKILGSLPIGMVIHYSMPSSLAGGALKISFSKTKDIFVWQDINNNYKSQIYLRPIKLENTLVKNVIKNNLYISAKKSGIPENTILEMIALLGFSVDFQREIRKGDSFEILFTKKIDILSDEVIQTKPITYVSIILSGKRLNFYNFEDKYGLPQYYDEKGKSSKRTIMKTPINGARLSSKYGNRKHPILGYTKMHRGLDFAAPTGTPVFAAGDGIVEKAGWNGSYGKYIRIRHTGTYKTAYAHLSGFHKNIKVGKRISQGKTIGYVGSTGRSTGPHLHYEVIKNNVQVNPMRIKIPAGKNIPQSNILDYQNHIKNILSLKIILEKSIDNKKLATNNYSNSKPLIFN
jgi:murein DD-endopeptidase MepM/ murein hydrolase activator NlpD